MLADKKTDRLMGAHIMGPVSYFDVKKIGSNGFRFLSNTSMPKL